MKSIVFLVAVLLAVSGGGACGGKGATATPAVDGSLNGNGGSAGTDAGLDATEPNRDADRLTDLAADIGPDVAGGPGCGVGSLCASLQAVYSETIQRAKSCMGGDAACSAKAVGSLGCYGCPVWVTNSTELDALSTRFHASGCGQCFFGSPTGARCHSTVCPDLGVPMCAVGPSGQGTCVDRPKDRTCPGGIMTGSACTPLDDYCYGGGKFCTCLRAMKTWLC
ncbi:MAG: hypothetical protein H7X95_11080 [Deltaproteobacteria bacterium]|nr:hypothetical protein [Deltaproteobacteria bacterium]